MRRNRRGEVKATASGRDGRRWWVKLRRTKITVAIAGVILAAFVITGIFAPLIAPYDPTENDLQIVKAPPFFQDGAVDGHPLGTDQLGRDILSRVIWGARISLLVAVIGVLGSGVIGITLGVVSGYRGGVVDALVQRAVDVLLGLPIIVVAMVVAIARGPSFGNVVLLLILTFWASYARQARAEALKLRNLGFVTLARTSGTSNTVIMFRHIVPNLAGTMLVLATLNVGTMIMMEATLSFLGAGIAPPTASWGLMVADGRTYVTGAWWLSFMPGLAISLVVLSCNIFGDWLRDRLDPKLRTT